MKSLWKYLLILLYLSICLSACGGIAGNQETGESTEEESLTQDETTVDGENETEEGDFGEWEEWRSIPMQIGGYGSKLCNAQLDENNRSYLTYTGGEVTVEYELEFWFDGNENAAGIGLWILVDGIPQSFRLDDGEECSYMHMIFPESRERDTYRFSFVPVAGEVGDELDLRVGYVAAPYYMPKQGTSYKVNGMLGHFNKTVLKFEETSPGIEEPYTQLITDLVVTNQELTVEKRDEWLRYLNFPSDEDGNPKVESQKVVLAYQVYVDESEVYGARNKTCYLLEDKEMITLKLECMMGLDIPYRCVIYLDNEPVGWTESIERNSSCERTTVEMKLDVSGIEDCANLRIVFATTETWAEDTMYWFCCPRLLLYR